ncbi:hypothetical protein [Agathobacter sp.]|uniref:hypothetical protein n=1 Tax=Agathobacter sp. TaxID=2021311 RepID=UPI002579C0F9|nr:hypothetical protein [Agathobacter sp.]
MDKRGITTTEAAYTYGDEWYEAVKKYIKANIDFVDDYIRENIPGVKAIPTEGTYLVWLDSGSIFGKTGAGFGSASADKFLSESVRILAERLTQSELVPRLS